MPHADPETRRAYLAEWRKDHPHYERDRRRGLPDDWREKQNAYMREWRVANIERVRGYERRRKFGLTPEQYQDLLEAQNHRCAICEALDDVLAVDHDHDTGAIRGLLCRNCNTILGMAGDNIERLMRAADYLTKE